MHTIELEFSEVDRQTADCYCNTHTCLIGTALMNRGYNVKYVGGSHVNLETGCYIFENPVYSGFYNTIDPIVFLHCNDNRVKPFYDPAVVGTKIRITCKDYTPPVKTEDVQKPSQHLPRANADKLCGSAH